MSSGDRGRARANGVDRGRQRVGQIRRRSFRRDGALRLELGHDRRRSERWSRACGHPVRDVRRRRRRDRAGVTPPQPRPPRAESSVVGVIGRSLVDEGNGTAHRGIRPTARYRCATRFAPGLVPLLWLVGYQGSITSTLLRTQAVRDAGGFADADIAEDWHLAARLSRRGTFICVDESVRIYHRHEGALRTRGSRKSAADQRHAICEDCPVDPASTRVQRCAAAVIRVRSR